MKRVEKNTLANPFLFPGEQQAINSVCEYGAKYGYGNLIHHLRNAWSQTLQVEHGLAREVADMSSGHSCAYCGVDFRTGKKIIRKQNKKNAKRKDG